MKSRRRNDPPTFNVWMPEAYREKMRKAQEGYYKKHGDMPSKAAVIKYALDLMDIQDFIKNHRAKHGI